MPPATATDVILQTENQTSIEQKPAVRASEIKMCLTTPATSSDAAAAAHTASLSPVTTMNNNCNESEHKSQSIRFDSTDSKSEHLRNRKSVATAAPTTTTTPDKEAAHTDSNDVNTSIVSDYLESEKLDSTKADEAAAAQFTPQIRWPDFIVQLSLHIGMVYGLYLLCFVKYLTILWFLFLVVASGFGITAGAHRLWSHRTYKAKMPLRLLLIFIFSIAGQRDAYTWALDHRIHHKFSETDADPHNAKRGFFFAHVGWLFLTPHPKVVEKRKVIDMSDLEEDQVVQWQRRLYIPIFALCVIAMPTLVPWYYWQEDLWAAFWTCFCCRFTIVLNIAFFVNSVAHMYGNKPYDKKISPTESLPVAIAAFGEGWHNYHHVFPWDYKTGEFGDYKFNVSTAFIDFFSKIGWAYDRKSVSKDMIARRAAKCGDGTHFLCDESAHEDPVWGYGDKDIPHDDIAELEKMHN